MTDNEIKEDCLQEAGIDLGRYSYNEMAQIKDALRRYHNAKLKLLSIADVSGWVSYDWNKPETRPTKYGKYFVHRKDGKVHWETWNGSGWAYNGNVITFWMEVLPPCH
jgi:hypothetical protein